MARVHVLPSVGAYVGGDITAGVISSGMYATEKLTLFIDIGTNGEMVLGNKDWLLSCACSAGPAFEGGGVRDGMRASPGAIEDVFIDDATWEPTFRTIDDAPAVGICGSGLIDLLGELFVTGLLDKSGHLDLEAPTARIRVRDGVPEYVVCRAGEGDAEKDIVLTESDITSLIRAKAAIYAGFEVLCASVGVDLADVEQILIGGAFGQYLNVEKAIRIGLLPDQPVETLPLPRQHERAGGVRHAALRQRPPRGHRRGEQDDLPGAERRQHVHGRVHVGALPPAHRPHRVPERPRGAGRAGRRERKRRLTDDHHDRRRRQGGDRQDDAAPACSSAGWRRLRPARSSRSTPIPRAT